MVIKNNEIYIINQPEKIILSLIVIDLNLYESLEDNIHDILIKLKDYSDLFFVFTSEQNKTDKVKFTSLYRGCGFIVSPGNIHGIDLFKVLQYDLEVLSDQKRHLAVTISRMSDLNKVNETYLENLHPMVGQIGRPVFKCRLLGSKELHDIYTLPDNIEINTEEKGIFKTILGILKHKRELDCEGMFNTWHSESPIMYFPRSVIEQFMSYSKINFDTWIKSFTTTDPRFIFSSLTNLLGLKILNLNLDEVKL